MACLGAQKNRTSKCAVFGFSAIRGLGVGFSDGLFDAFSSFVSLVHAFKPAIHVDHARAGDIDGIDRRDEDPERHDDGEIARRAGTDNGEWDDGKERRAARNRRSGEAIVDRFVHDFG